MKIVARWVTNFIKGHKIQWLGYTMRQKENDLLKAAFEWIPEGRRPCGRPRKKWLDRVEEDLRELDIESRKYLNKDDLLYGIQALLKRWNSYIDKHGDYIKGL